MAVYIDSLETIKKKLHLEKNGEAQAFMTATCAKAMDKYLPFDEGILAGTAIQNGQPTSNVKVDRIIYSQPYAEYVYKGVSKSGKPLNYQTDKHPGAGPYWDKRMISADMHKVVKQVQDRYGR